MPCKDDFSMEFIFVVVGVGFVIAALVGVAVAMDDGKGYVDTDAHAKLGERHE